MEKTESELIDDGEKKKESLVEKLKNMTPSQKRKATTIAACCAVAFLLLCYVQF